MPHNRPNKTYFRLVLWELKVDKVTGAGGF